MIARTIRLFLPATNNATTEVTLMHRGDDHGATHRSAVRADSLRSTRVRLHMSRRRERRELQLLDDQLPLNLEEPGGEEDPSTAS
jgi:hypothetical protein